MRPVAISYVVWRSVLVHKFSVRGRKGVEIDNVDKVDILNFCRTDGSDILQMSNVSMINLQKSSCKRNEHSYCKRKQHRNESQSTRQFGKTNQNVLTFDRLEIYSLSVNHLQRNQ